MFKVARTERYVVGIEEGPRNDLLPSGRILREILKFAGYTYSVTMDNDYVPIVISDSKEEAVTKLQKFISDAQFALSQLRDLE